VSYFFRKYDIKNILLLILFGSILPFSMAPFDFWFLGIVSVGGFSVLALRCIQEKLSFRLVFYRSLSYAIGLYSVGASWIFVSIHRYGQASLELSALLITLFIIFLSILFALPFAIFSKLNQIKSASIDNLAPSYNVVFAFFILFPSLWVLGEWFREWAFSGFPWLYLGYAHTDSWLSGWAPITGVLGISWIVAFCGALIGFLFQLKVKTKIPQKKFISIPIICSLSLVIFFWVGGLYLKKIEWTKPLNKPVSVGLIQPAISLWHSWNPEKLNSILSQYRKDTRSLINNDLVVWPEAAIPVFQDEVSDYLDSIKKEAIAADTAIIIGVPTILRTHLQSNKKNNPRYFNSALVLGQGSGIYHKQHLVPFGEYVPFEKWLRGAIKFFDLPMSAFSSGPKDQRNIIIKNNINIGTSICYEIAYSELVRNSAKNSNILLTMSNDSWFGKTIGPKQHFQIARMRAIENGKALIRATNDGVSALIEADGKVSVTIPSFNRGILEGTLYPRSGSTPFANNGSCPVIILSFLLVFVGWRIQK
tara:strand:- start:49021 stop:50622 length:1602 start_codon:yes stop_codon:yes gene_type:complete